MIGAAVKSEETSPAATPIRRFLIGPAGERAWIVRDETGVSGAVFSSREDALHYARSECEALRPRAAHWVLVDEMEWPALFAKHGRQVA